MTMTLRRPRLGRRSTLRWAVPAGLAVAVGVATFAPSLADAAPTLPPRTAAQLLAAIPASAAQPFSGTVSQTARLGLPELPSGPAAHQSPTSWTTLLAGTHTMRVWYAGPDQQRINLVEGLAESDVIRSGDDLWTWESTTMSATHLVLPTHRGAGPAPMPGSGLDAPGTGPITPLQAATQALAAISPTTEVVVDGTASVAGRSAYELVLTPRSGGSLVREVRLAVDAGTSTPLRVEIFGAAARPAFETAFTSITFATPDAGIFAFTPPPGSTVHQVPVPDRAAAQTAPGSAATVPARPARPTRPGVRVTGTGWSSVIEIRTSRTGSDGPASGMPDPTDSTKDGDGGPDRGATSSQLQTLLGLTRPTSGSFGTGRSVQTALVSVLVLQDGRAFIGAVPVSTLVRAASAAPATTGQTPSGTTPTTASTP